MVAASAEVVVVVVVVVAGRLYEIMMQKELPWARPSSSRLLHLASPSPCLGGSHKTTGARGTSNIQTAERRGQ
jgi:hypothetical protein